MTLKPLASTAALAVLLSAFLPWVDLPVLGEASLYEAGQPIYEKYRALADLGFESILEEIRGQVPWQGLVLAASFATAALTFVTASFGLGPRFWALATAALIAVNVTYLVIEGPQFVEGLGLPRGLVPTDPADLWAAAPLGPKAYVIGGSGLLFIALIAPAAPRRRRRGFA